MGRAANYKGDRAKLKSWNELERRVSKNENLTVEQGKGRYPYCLPEKPFPFCPKETPEDPKNVPKECKFCPHFLNSRFYSEHFAQKAREERLKRLQEMGLPTRIEE